MAVYKVNVEGMMCEHCEANLASAVKKSLGITVREVVCSHKKGECIIKTVLPVKDEKIKQAIENAGFVYGGINEQK